MHNHSICLGCMQEKGQAQVCPFCGYKEGTPAQAPHYLQPGTVLAGKYLIGRGLGHGGFGTTYIARDEVLGIKLAIKEYLPQDCASRQPGSSMVIPFSGAGEKRFSEGLESFLQEARTLARFDGSQNIVSVRDFFTENGTAYLVMNYLEGITLKQYLVRSGGKPVPFEKTLGIMLPVMDALHTVHAAGLLHRDVSPDNIFLTTSGQVTLIDFGAARQSMNVQRSMSVILKPGYAPEEQYRSRGRQGPWTDVYALGATMYRTLTGKIPPESLERLNQDCLIPPSRLGIQIPAYAEAALMRAMAVHAEDRFQSIEEFRSALLCGANPVPKPQAAPADREKAPTQRRESQHPHNQQEEPVTYPLGHKSKKKKKGVRPVIVVAAIMMALIIGVVALFFVYLTTIMGNNQQFGNLDFSNPAASDAPEVTNKPEQTPVPAEPDETDASDMIEPSPSEEAEPAVDPSLLPFIQGTAPADDLQSFAPIHGRIMMIEDHGNQNTWVTGLAPNAQPDLLSAMFVYDVQKNTPVGDIYGYRLDESGNLRYWSSEEGGQGKMVLPAECTVGSSFNGVMGNCTVFAVNYSGSHNGMDLMNCIVLRCDEGYAFYQPKKGLVLLQSEFEGGEVYYRLLSDEDDNQSIYSVFVE